MIFGDLAEPYEPERTGSNNPALEEEVTDQSSTPQPDLETLTRRDDITQQMYDLLAAATRKLVLSKQEVRLTSLRHSTFLRANGYNEHFGKG
jgi:hypothetical protein